MKIHFYENLFMLVFDWESHVLLFWGGWVEGLENWEKDLFCTDDADIKAELGKKGFNEPTFLVLPYPNFGIKELEK